ncbi:MAG: PH domain-containing protein [Methanobacterium sp.]|nr:PH domain-containing protein [Methanobacterium sp.]
MDEDIRVSYNGEKVLFETRPRFTLYLGSTMIKIIILFLLLYFFTAILALTASVQYVLVSYIQIPLVTWTAYFLLLVLFILFLWIVWEIFNWRATRYILTTQRVMIKKGIIRKRKIYMPYHMIQDIDISQGLLERLFKAGDIEISGGHEHTQLIMEDTPNPSRMESTINRLMQGEDIGFRQYKRTEDQRSVIEEYDRKFKLR